MRTRFALGLAIGGVLAATAAATAGGLTLPARGVRTLARGGAFVAGADDADALWQNPAGLAHGAGRSKRTLLFDVAYVYQTVDHARVDAAGTATPVSNQQPGQPVPTLAGSLGIGDRLVIAGGLAAPYAATAARYPVAGSQRYASIDTTGTQLVTVALGIAYRVSDRLRVGATVQDTFSRLAWRLAVDGCPDAACAPEDPAFDAELAIEQTDYVAPSASIGVQYDAARIATVGLALQAPTRISAPGTLALTLPVAAAFQDAEVIGDAVEVAYTLPAVIRAGVELRPRRGLRVEAAVEVELWSLHDEVSIAPTDVAVQTTAGARLAVGRMVIPRAYRTTVSPSLGVEWHGPKLMLGAGYAYETAAAPPAYVSVLAVDAAKHVVGLGGGYEEAGWQIGAAAGLALAADVDVPLAAAKLPALSPFGAPPPGAGPVNAGTYRSRTFVAGLRFARRW